MLDDVIEWMNFEEVLFVIPYTYLPLLRHKPRLIWAEYYY